MGGGIPLLGHPSILGNHGAVYSSDCKALWCLTFLCSLLCSAWATWGWQVGGEDASGSLPPRPCSWAHENHSVPHHAFGARGALRCGHLTGTHLLEGLPASLSAQGLPNICLLWSLSFLGTVVPASFVFLPLEQGSVPMCACSSHPVHTPSSQGLGFWSSNPFSIF